MQLIEKISVRQLTGFPSNELIDEFHLLRLHEQQHWLALALQDANWLSPSVRYWPILLKKSAMVSTVEKYALEIEICTLSRGFRARISRSSAQERRFQRSIFRQAGRTDFFNRIGRLLPVAMAAFGGFLPILDGGDDQQRSNSGGLPFVCGSELLADRQRADI